MENQVSRLPLTASLLAQSNPALFAPVVAYDSGGLNAESVAVADPNRDNKPDLVVANLYPSPFFFGPGTIGVLLGNGDGTFQSVRTYPSGAFKARHVTVADVNGDGNPDLVVAQITCDGLYTCPGVVTVLLGKGDGTFQEPVAYGAGGWVSFWVVVADVNNDGKPDLIASNETGCIRRRSIRSRG